MRIYFAGYTYSKEHELASWIFQGQRCELICRLASFWHIVNMTPYSVFDIIEKVGDKENG